MRLSRSLIPTARTGPIDATLLSHQLLVRSGAIRAAGAGVYEMLPLGMRVLRKLEDIVREELSRSGAQEVLLPTLLPSKYFQESGRWDAFGPTLFRVKDRNGNHHNLNPTHEEAAVAMVRPHMRSYRDLPLNVFQIQKVYRDEARPRGGLLRCREFIMADSYSFDESEAGAQATYIAMQGVYRRILDRLNLEYRLVAADSGPIGGKVNAEFQALVNSGEDSIVVCAGCGYAANSEVARSRPPKARTSALEAPPCRQRSSDARTVHDIISEVPGLAAADVFKSVAYRADEQVVLVVVPGDREVNETKLRAYLGGNCQRVSISDAVPCLDQPLGFVGPVGFCGRILADEGLRVGRIGIAGCNEDGVHAYNVVPGRDFDAEFADVAHVKQGDCCPACDSLLQFFRGIELAHIFVLGTRYSEPMDAKFADRRGERKPVVMGCTGIGLTRLIAAIVEQNHDEYGIAWPLAVAPFSAVVISLESHEDVARCAADLYESIVAARVDVLLDDRQRSPGTKLSDADMMGIPVRITVSARHLGDGCIEIRDRIRRQPQLVPIGEACDHLLRMLKSWQDRKPLMPDAQSRLR